MIALALLVRTRSCPPPCPRFNCCPPPVCLPQLDEFPALVRDILGKMREQSGSVARVVTARSPLPSPPPSASPREEDETDWEKEGDVDPGEGPTDSKPKGKRMHWRSGFLKGKATLGIMRK